jgi:tRNA-intron endonuclease, archaea type
MMISGELINNYVIITKPKEAGRLYNKSHFGTMLSGNNLEIDLLEAVFLKEEEKIRIFQNKKEIDFETLFKIATKEISDFEIKYLVFKDLRSRGQQIKNCNIKNICFCSFNEEIFISVFSERGFFDLENTTDLVKKIKKEEKKLWFGLVDEEGDITYYEVSLIDINGNNKEQKYQKAECLALKDRVIIFDEKLSNKLFEKEFYGKKLAKGLQLSFVEALYLKEKGFIQLNKDERDIQIIQPDVSLRLIVFRDLKKKGLIVKTGFKFGSHFRVYTKKPYETHAEYLIHVVKKGFTSSWAEMSRAVRLAHSVNKEIVFARVLDKKIDYIKFGRLRP